jgi:hypothetical protein
VCPSARVAAKVMETTALASALHRVLEEVQSGEFTEDEVEQEMLTRKIRAVLRTIEREGGRGADETRWPLAP